MTATSGHRVMLLGIQATLLGFVVQSQASIPFYEPLGRLGLVVGTLLVASGFAAGRGE